MKIVINIDGRRFLHDINDAIRVSKEKNDRTYKNSRNLSDTEKESI